MDDQTDWNAFLKAAKEVEAKYLLELEKNRALLEQISSIKRGSSQTGVAELQKQFNLVLKGLREECERLKTTYPVFDLLAAKQIEVDRMKKAFHALSDGHSDRKAIEGMVKAHIIERDELLKIAEEAESRLQKQLDKIHASYLKASRGQPSRGDSESQEKSPPPIEWVRVPEF